LAETELEERLSWRDQVKRERESSVLWCQKLMVRCCCCWRASGHKDQTHREEQAGKPAQNCESRRD